MIGLRIINNDDFTHCIFGYAGLTLIILAFSNIYFKKTKRHTEIKLAALEGELKKTFCKMLEKRHNLNYGHWNQSC
jgi:hypothetical protein